MLKSRYVEVLHHAAAGYSVSETARRLGLSYSTIRHLRSDAIHEMHSRTMAGAVVIALIRGVLDLKEYPDPPAI